MRSSSFYIVTLNAVLFACLLFRTNGQSVYIPCKYNFVSRFSEGLAAVYLNNKWCFIDKAGKLVISLKYENALAIPI